MDESAEMAHFTTVKTEVKEEISIDVKYSPLSSLDQTEQPQHSEESDQPLLTDVSTFNIKPEPAEETNQSHGVKTENDIENDSSESFDEPDFFVLPESEDRSQSDGPSTSRSSLKCGSCSFSTDKDMVFEIHLRDCALETRYTSMVSTMLVGLKQRCYFCPFESHDLDTLKEHHGEHSSQGHYALFQCDKCTYSTQNRFQLVTHTLTHSKFKCERCPYFHIYKKCVDKHSKNHNFSVKRIAACTSCSFEAMDPGVWEGHLTAHKLSGQAVDISCAGCSFRSDAPFNQRSVEVHHKDTKHRGFLAEISTFRCTQCTYATYFKWDYIQHTKSYHTDSTPVSKKVLSCGKCAFVAGSKSEVKDHFENKHARIVYQCKECQFQTRRKERYELHMINVTLKQKHEKRHHRITDLVHYKCEICNFTGTGEGDLNTHRLLHKTQELMVTITDNSYKCQICTFTTTNEHILTTHELLHSDAPKNNIQSSVIDQSFPAPKSLEEDQKTVPTVKEGKEENIDLEVKTEPVDYQKAVETGNKRSTNELSNLQSTTNKKPKTSPYKCFYCEFEADQKIEVDRHEKTTHRTFDGLFTCPYCPYETTKRCDLRRHYTRKHQNSLKCNNCPYETGSKSDYIQHKAGHKRDGHKLHQCAVCEYTSDRKSMVQRHELTHQEMNVFCDMCEYRTRRKDDLVRHKKRHQSEECARDSSNISCRNTYKCLSCLYETTVETDFNGHVNFHKENNHKIFYKCTNCSSTFPDLEAFKVHQNESSHSQNLITIEVSFNTNFASHLSRCNIEFEGAVEKHESSDQATYKCIGCNFQSPIKKEFDDHFINHKVNQETAFFVCEYCKLKFVKFSEFRKHQDDTKHVFNLVTIDILTISCKFCLYCTWRTKKLDIHIESHKNIHANSWIVYLKPMFKKKLQLIYRIIALKIMMYCLNVSTIVGV